VERRSRFCRIDWQELGVLAEFETNLRRERQPKIVGWSMADHLRAGLCVDALVIGLQRRRPPEGLVHHSDRGVGSTLPSPTVGC
jgi:transposase InsO family protein